MSQPLAEFIELGHQLTERPLTVEPRGRVEQARTTVHGGTVGEKFSVRFLARVNDLVVHDVVVVVLQQRPQVVHRAAAARRAAPAAAPRLATWLLPLFSETMIRPFELLAAPTGRRLRTPQ